MAATVIAIPHAGLALPEEVQVAVRPRVTEHFLRTQSDAFTDRVYRVERSRCVIYPWSRFVADPNRAPTQSSEGGVVPHTDFSESPLYREGCEPDQQEKQQRLKRYHQPFHQQVRQAVADPRTRFFIDGHSMAGTAPLRSPDFGLPRPDAVLSNLGDSQANPAPGTPYLTCSPEMTRWLGERLGHWLKAVPAPQAAPEARVEGSVTYNTPFKGGYGVRTHAAFNRGLPGLQLELNQRLWTDESSFELRPRRLPWIREVLRRWIEELDGALSQATPPQPRP